MTVRLLDRVGLAHEALDNLLNHPDITDDDHEQAYTCYKSMGELFDTIATREANDEDDEDDE